MLSHFGDHLEFALKLLRHKRTLLARLVGRLSSIDHFTNFIFGRKAESGRRRTVSPSRLEGRRAGLWVTIWKRR
jgi:hypothetical protein